MSKVYDSLIHYRLLITSFVCKWIYLFGRLFHIRLHFIHDVGRNAVARLRGLPQPLETDVWFHDVVTPTEDNCMLHGTVYSPAELSKCTNMPVVIIRTPYGRNLLGPEWARIFAERGYICLLQDTRGRFGSGGDFFPVKNEIVDGAKTIDWVREQPWCNGNVYLFGVSYLGLTAYAAAGSSSGHHVRGCVPVVACAKSYNILYHSESGALSLDLMLRWLWVALKLMDSVHIFKLWFPSLQGDLKKSLEATPLIDQDKILLGKEFDFYQQAMSAHEEDHEFWDDKNVLCDFTDTHAPTHIIAGWYDFFCKQSFDDYKRAIDSGSQFCRMTVGKWKHWDTQLVWPSLCTALRLFDESERSGGYVSGTEIQVEFLGTETPKWGIYTNWPPPECRTREFILKHLKHRSEFDYSAYRWDPADPTPSVGGPSFCPVNSGRINQAELATRDDVISFQTDEMRESIYVCGDVYFELTAASSNPHTDFFIKVCEVQGNDIFNIVEHLIRMTPSDWTSKEVDENGSEMFRIEKRRIKIGPIAIQLHARHQLQILIAGGAHPLYCRNHGTDHHFAHATELKHADHRVYHESRLILPVVREDHIVDHPLY